MLLIDLEARTPQSGKPLRVVDLLVLVQGVLPELTITIDQSAGSFTVERFWVETGPIQMMTPLMTRCPAGR